MPEAPRVTQWPIFRPQGAIPSRIMFGGTDSALGDCAEALGKEPLDALFDFCRGKKTSASLFERTAESTERAFLDDPARALGAIPRLHDRRLRCRRTSGHAQFPSPFSTQLLGEGVRQRELLSLEEAVPSHQPGPAGRALRSDRPAGRIAVGCERADLVIFDPETVDCGPIAMRKRPAGWRKARLYADRHRRPGESSSAE